MDATLCRRLAAVLSSPFYFDYLTLQDDPDKVRGDMERVCTEAVTEDKLPEPMQRFFQTCDRSIEIAKSKGYRYPYTSDQINDVMEAMSDD